jgi:hypothetical protein
MTDRVPRVPTVSHCVPDTRPNRDIPERVPVSLAYTDARDTGHGHDGSPQRRTVSQGTPVARTRENVESKGRRYLTEGRLRVLLVKGGRVFAECRGAGAIWHPSFIGGRWVCDCPRGRCCHLVALQLVVAPPCGDAP